MVRDCHTTATSKTWRHPSFMEEADDFLLVVRVRDTGRGMADAEVLTCTDPFTRTLVDNASGTGLGLHITLAYVLAHRGSLTITSCPRVGTCVTLRFCVKGSAGSTLSPACSLAASAPSTALAASRHATAPPPPLQVEVSAAHGSVLVVDDQTMNARLLQRLVQRIVGPAVHVGVAHDGMQAVETVMQSHARVALVLLDLNMPRMDGLEATRRIRAADLRWDQPRIAIVTGSTSPEDRAAAMAAGADAYVPKPCSLNAVVGHLRPAFSGIELHAGSAGIPRGEPSLHGARPSLNDSFGGAQDQASAIMGVSCTNASSLLPLDPGQLLASVLSQQSITLPAAPPRLLVGQPRLPSAVPHPSSGPADPDSVCEGHRRAAGCP